MSTSYEDIEVVILTAGLGTRLRPMTNVIPKVMVPIAEHLPLLEHTLLLLKAQGFRKFIFNLFHLSEKITNHFQDGSRFGVRIRYSDESKQRMETAGAIKKMESMIESENFLLIYGDHLSFYDFRELVDLHTKRNSFVTILLCRSDDPQNGDLAEIDVGSQKIIRWHARPHPFKTFDSDLYLNSGFEVLSKKIFDYIPNGRPVKLDDEIIPYLVNKEEIYGIPSEEVVLNLNTPEKYEYAKKWYAMKLSQKG